VALIHPVLTLAVVTVTANHYWSDGIVAAVLVVAALAVTSGLRRDARDPAAEAPPAGATAALPELSG
jgi:hypothetical protein